MENQQPPRALPQIIHQKQRLQLCLLHALNNLFQGETTFSRAELNSIAINLSAQVQFGGGLFLPVFSIHHNAITGNYDANVLMGALQSRRTEAVWFDRRKGVAGLDLKDAEQRLVGIIMNHPTAKFAGLVKGRHWAALKKIDGLWYDLDSDLSTPFPFVGGEEGVKEFLEQSFAGGSEAFIVLRTEANVEKDTLNCCLSSGQ